MDNKLVRNKQGLTEEEFLREYDAGKFERPSVTVDMLVFTVMEGEKENYRKLSEKALKILMIKRGEHPYLGQWALPGGFVNIHESIDEAADRELRSETNVDNIYMEQLYTFGDIDRDPRTRVISCSYMALVDSSMLELSAGEDADEAEWFDVEYKVLEQKKNTSSKGYTCETYVKIFLRSGEKELSATVKITEKVEGKIVNVQREIVESSNIAFDHGKMIQYAIERLKSKIEYTSLVFNLMPELFTLTELQQVYEVILGKKLLAPAFRRKIAEMVVETDEYTKDAGHRPSKFYKFNSEWRLER